MSCVNRLRVSLGYARAVGLNHKYVFTHKCSRYAIAHKLMLSLHVQRIQAIKTPARSLATRRQPRMMLEKHVESCHLGLSMKNGLYKRHDYSAGNVSTWQAEKPEMLILSITTPARLVWSDSEMICLRLWSSGGVVTNDVNGIMRFAAHSIASLHLSNTMSFATHYVKYRPFLCFHHDLSPTRFLLAYSVTNYDLSSHGHCS